MNHPKEMQWYDGDLPDVHTVPYDCCILAWFVNDFPGGPESKEWLDTLRWYGSKKYAWEDVHNHLRRIEMLHPWRDDLNPLRWWAWIRHPFLVGKLLDERNT